MTIPDATTARIKMIPGTAFNAMLVSKLKDLD